MREGSERALLRPPWRQGAAYATAKQRTAGVVYSDMEDWRRFGRAPHFPGRKMKGVIAKTTGCSMTRKGSRRGLSIRLWPQRLDRPSTLGIGGIGYNTVSGGASARGDC